MQLLHFPTHSLLRWLFKLARIQIRLIWRVLWCPLRPQGWEASCPLQNQGWEWMWRHVRVSLATTSHCDETPAENSKTRSTYKTSLRANPALGCALMPRGLALSGQQTWSSGGLCGLPASCLISSVTSSSRPFSLLLGGFWLWFWLPVCPLPAPRQNILMTETRASPNPKCNSGWPEAGQSVESRTWDQAGWSRAV